MDMVNLIAMSLIELVRKRSLGCPETKETIRVSVRMTKAGISATVAFNLGSHQ
jgi:hypothetical protein